MDPLSIIASTIALIQATSKAYQTIQHLKNLPKEFEEVKLHFPLVEDTLRLAQGRLHDENLSEASTGAIVPVLEDCQDSARKLKDIFFEVKTRADGSVYRTFLLRLGNLGKARRVETLMQKLAKGVQKLALNDAFRTSTESQVAKLQEAIDNLASVKSSVPDAEFPGIVPQNVQNVSDRATGNQANNTGSGLMKQINGGTVYDSSGGAMNFAQNLILNNFVRASETGSDDFSVPFKIPASKRIEHFIGRETEVAAIHEKLQGQDTRRVVAIHAMGGMGKTQLSLEYVKRYKKAYSAIFWLNASNSSSVQLSFVKVAEQIHQAHPSVCALDVEALDAEDKEERIKEVVRAVRDWLSLAKNTQWLLICDNYDNPKVKNNKVPEALDICDFLPEADHGSVLITTRVARAGIGYPLPIGKMDETESLEVLSTTSGRDGVLDDADAKELVKILDGLPLALASAGAYLRLVQTSFREYLSLYNNQWSKLQMSDHDLDTYDHTLYTTWQLSYERVQGQDVLAANLLRWWAYFDNHDVWFELLQRCNKSKEVLPWMQQLTANKLVFDAAARVLVNHGLIEKDDTTSLHDPTMSRGYSMHACVHAWTFHVLNAEFDCSLVLAAMRCVKSLYFCKTDPVTTFFSRLLRVLPHAKRCFSLLPTTVSGKTIGHLLWYTGTGFCFAGDFSTAESVHQRAYHEMMQAVGPDNFRTWEQANTLATVYAKNGKLEAAEELLSRTLSSIEATAGPGDRSTLLIAHWQGALFIKQHKYEAAENLLLRARSGLGELNFLYSNTTIQSIDLELGRLYAAQGKYSMAEETLLRLLSGVERDLYKDYTIVWAALAHLSQISRAQKKYDEAEMWWKLLTNSLLWEKTGPDDLLTLQFVKNVGAHYILRGKHTMAEEMPSRALPSLERTVGEAHQVAVDAVKYLGDLYIAEGRHDKAQKIFARISGETLPAPLPVPGDISSNQTPPTQAPGSGDTPGKHALPVQLSGPGDASGKGALPVEMSGSGDTLGEEVLSVPVQTSASDDTPRKQTNLLRKWKGSMFGKKAREAKEEGER